MEDWGKECTTRSHKTKIGMSKRMMVGRRRDEKRRCGGVFTQNVNLE